MMRRLVLLTFTAAVAYVRPRAPRPATAWPFFLFRTRASRRRRSSPLAHSHHRRRQQCPRAKAPRDVAARALEAHAVEAAEPTSRVRTRRCPRSAGWLQR